MAWTREETRHLARVLRLGVGDRVEVCDGAGRNVEARVAVLAAGGAQLQVLRELAFWGESPLRLVLGIGLAKGEALDGVLRQATEMGVQQIIPFHLGALGTGDPGAGPAAPGALAAPGPGNHQILPALGAAGDRRGAGL